MTRKISLDQETYDLLKLLSKQKNSSIAYIAKDLIHEALEQYEDQQLLSLAEKRDLKDAKRVPLETTFNKDLS